MKRIISVMAILATIGCSQAKNSDKKTDSTAQAAPEIDTKALDEAYRGQVDSNYKKEAKQAAPNIDLVPPIRILTTDSVYFNNTNLQKDKPLMIVYFSPDCDHCVKFIEQLKPQLQNFSGYQILMITWLKYEAVVPFYQKYGLAKFKNIVVGTEGDDLLVQQYFQIKETPYIAIYGRNGKLVKAYDKAPKVPELIAAAKKAL